MKVFASMLLVSAAVAVKIQNQPEDSTVITFAQLMQGDADLQLEGPPALDGGEEGGKG